ncbi:MRG-domain-containing protein [Phyllosticta citribraziliensis]|uniref:Chromatin modification-related protein EAF3 n=1 Tax=Phyllosticta citribraziliensis TaxID=989973 RepID=A0ABR1MBC4_9PEZI
MAPSSQPYFQKDEKALCFHHELLYEAKVLDVKQVDPSDKKSAYQYKVHYKGWKATWDDWVPQDRLRKLTDENRELAASLRKEMEAIRRSSTAAKGASSAHKKKVTDMSSMRGSEGRETPAGSTSLAGRKRGRDFEIEKEEQFRTRPAVRIPMPDKLKSVLVDDWEQITKNLHLTKVPSLCSVSTVLSQYETQERTKRIPGSADWDILQEVMQGIKEYFRKALGRILLYRFERDQYLEVHKKMESPNSPGYTGRSLEQIYGPEHLLRLLVSLPDLIAQTNMDPQSVNRLREELLKLTMWIAKDENANRFFRNNYEPADQEYIEKAKGDEKH